MKLNEEDLKRALKLLPESVKDVVMATGAVVAGGFLRCVVNKEHVKDIDIFSKSPEYALDAAKCLNAYTTQVGEYKVVTSKNAYSLKNVSGYFVQFIHRWYYPDPESLLNSFDFTIARAAIWYDKTTNQWDSLVDDEFYADVAAKRLSFKFPERQEDPAGSLLRVIKFAKKGYYIPSKSLAGVVARVARHAEELYGDTFAGTPEFQAPDEEQQWTRIIHSSIATVTGES